VVAAEPDSLLGITTNSTGVETGLCVHIGSTDGAIEIQMAGNGRRLVCGPALDDQSLDSARKAIHAQGLYPLASVEKARTPEQLPYADNLVSLLIADLDALGKRAPSRKEIMGVRLANGRAISEWVVENKDKKAAKNYLGVWDAFSGIPLRAIEKRYWGT